jgi:flagellar basal-body rod modification protein FlgD
MAIDSISSLRTTEDYAVSQAQAEVERTSVLGQSDFLKLMTTQLMNQDPLQPMENGEFLAQMAQFSTVSGITEMNDSIQNLSESYRSQQLMQASGLINKSALVEGSFTELDPVKGLSGAFMIDKATDGTQIVIKNLQGEIVHTEQLGIKFPGMHEFKWDGITDDGYPAQPGQYLVEPVALDNGEPYIPTTLVYANVNAISTSPTGELLLEVAGVGNLPFNNVYRVGQ